MAKHKNKIEALFSGINLGHFFLGLLVILAGLSYLAQKIGFVSIDVGYIISHFWSLLLIWLGLSLLSRRQRLTQIAGLSLASVIIILVAVAIFSSPLPIHLGRSEQFNIGPAANVKTMELGINLGASMIKVAGNLNSKQAIFGSFQSEFLRLATSSVVEGDRQKIRLGALNIGGANRWPYLGQSLNSLDLKIGTNLPVNLYIDSAAADLTVDLRAVRAENISINSGASNIDLSLGEQVTRSSVSINAGASTVSLKIPRNLGVLVVLASNLASSNLPRLAKIGTNTYQSENYDRATKKTSIILNTGISRVDLQYQ